jgi:DNA-directed RNA polymerase subunit alpha
MTQDTFDQIPVETLGLSMKALGSLKRSQIATIADLMNYTQEDLEILDKECSEEVITALEQKFNLTLPLNDLQ